MENELGKSRLGTMAETIAEAKLSQGRSCSGVAIVPINTHGQTLSSIETEIVQVLARGRKASVCEKGIGLLLGPDLADTAVTEWANRLAAQYEVTWSRRQRFGGLLFELVKTERVG